MSGPHLLVLRTFFYCFWPHLAALGLLLVQHSEMTTGSIGGSSYGMLGSKSRSAMCKTNILPSVFLLWPLRTYFRLCAWESWWCLGDPVVSGIEFRVNLLQSKHITNPLCALFNPADDRYIINSCVYILLLYWVFKAPGQLILFREMGLTTLFVFVFCFGLLSGA